jgi:transposase
MTHRNAPLSVEGRRRLVNRCADRPIAHVAAEMGISRACASKWVTRFRQYGDVGLQDRSSTPHQQPTATPATVIATIETMRRQNKWPAARIAFELHQQGITIRRRTVSRHLAILGLHRRRFIDPNGQNQSRTTANRRAPTRPHGAYRRQKSWPNPRRRRLAHPRPRQPSRSRCCPKQRQRHTRRLRLSVLRH